MNRARLPHLYPVEYEHPFDRQALDRLENTRGLDLLTQKVLDNGLETYLRIKHTGDNLQINARNIPEIHDLLVEACRILSMPVVPELYLHLEDKIDSFSSGHKHPLVVISSGAVDLLNEDELLFLLGRELGHIKSNHVLYREMADSLTLVSQIVSDLTLGIGNLLSLPIRIALMHWYRMSEFTADRAGLLVCQDPEVATQALIKMAGLPMKYHGRISTEDFQRQARAFDEIELKTFNKFIRFIASYENPQPFTVIRGSQLFQWVEKGEYQRILTSSQSSGDEAPSGQTCPACQQPVKTDDRFCTECGRKLPVRNRSALTEETAISSPTTASAADSSDSDPTDSEETP